MASLGGGPLRVTPSMGDAPADSIQGWHPNESLNIFGGWIYKNTGRTITWNGGERASGDGHLNTPGDTNVSDATGLDLSQVDFSLYERFSKYCMVKLSSAE